ncbi:MAG: Uncharacterised protein [Flavobacteriales bacterium UBA4585]|nr:MAG: Uncharacterised protein [Flavobacteriales bacterium UBA4585]
MVLEFFGYCDSVRRGGVNTYGLIGTNGKCFSKGWFSFWSTDIEYGDGAAVGFLKVQSFGQAEFIVWINDELDPGGI